MSGPSGCHEDCPACAEERKAQHTPGPWVADDTGPANSCVVSSAGDLLAIGTQGANDKDEDTANVRLMAAAPELLELCTRFLLMHDIGNHNHASEPWMLNADIARAAIAKAVRSATTAPSPHRVTIEVSGGVAEVTGCPAGVEVVIVDHDNEQNGGAQ